MISILLPTFNQAKFLPEALASIALQTFKDYELIACDDGSTDRTADILRNTEIRTVTHELNRGTAKAINAAAMMASGQYMTWVSSDNTMTKDWLATLHAEMNPETGVVYSAFWYENGGNRQVMFRQYNPETLINDENCYFGPSFLIRTDVWREAGPHEGQISHDYGHWLRVEEVCWKRGLAIKGIDKPLCHYRAHDDRATVRLKHLYDADKHKEDAIRRRVPVQP